MSTSHFCLDTTFADNDLVHWYDTAAVGEMATVEIPSHACVVELRCRTRGHVLWHVLGGRSVTMSLTDAMKRFWMLHARRSQLLQAHTPT